jgi:hypothetical protein
MNLLDIKDANLNSRTHKAHVLSGTRTHSGVTKSYEILLHVDLQGGNAVCISVLKEKALCSSKTAYTYIATPCYKPEGQHP